MRIAPSAAAAIATALAAATLGIAGAAAAAPASHYSDARADWKHGATVDSADQSRSWLAAAKVLPTRDFHERHDLHVLAAIPETSTTAKQRATAKRDTRELNGFFRTRGLYGVSAGKPKKIARGDWIKANHVAAARQDVWLAAANDELNSFGKRYHHERAAITSLESIPLTSTTAKQRATSRRDVKILDTFFNTPKIDA